jgi:alkylhydroperoxidase family enzyme
VGSHAAVAAEFLGSRELVQSIIEDHRSAPISDKEKALFDYVQAANLSRGIVDKKWIDAAKKHGWSDAALYDAATVVALFNFYNRWIDSTGVQDMPAAAYAESGKRLKANGYAMFD